MAIAEFSTHAAREVCPPGFSRLEAFAQLNEQLSEILSDPLTPPLIRNAALSAVWLSRVDVFRALEDRFLINGEYQDQLDEHRLVLTELLSDGEKLLAVLKTEGLADTCFTIPDVAATLDSLRTTFHCEHGPRNPPMVNDFVLSLFDGEKR